MHLVQVPPKRVEEMFNEFYNKSMFTFEGIDIKDKKGMKLLTEHLQERGVEDPMGYWFDGKTMNEHFGLTESNAYPESVTFLVIPDFYDSAFKMAFGGKARWFDDIVSNNTIRQNAIIHKTPEDYGMEEAE